MEKYMESPDTGQSDNGQFRKNHLVGATATEND